MNSYIYKEGEDPNNNCILIPRYKALGRTAPNGKVYSEKPISNENEEDLVLVRSIISKKDGDLNVITPDLIGKKFKFTEGAAIGLSFATSLTEGTTQGALALKHGGHERVLNQEGILRAPKACQFREEGRWIYLKVRGDELKYPRPDNLVTVGGKDKFEKGELICTAYNTTSPISKLNSLIKLMKAKGSDGTRYFEKDNIILSDCYAYEAGKINYVETKDGDIEVWIGDRQYQYNPESMYYYPQGYEIKKYQRFCSGVVNMTHVVSELKDDINSIYLIFRNQFYTLTDSKFSKTGVTDLHSTQEELIELLFNSLIDMTVDPDTQKIESIRYQGTQTSVLSKKSFYTVLSYGYSSRVVSKALKGELDLAGDVMTDTVLGLLLNNKLDEKNEN